MTPTHKERLLADILAALLRIEALMQREKVADSDAVAYWAKRQRGQRPCAVTVYPQPLPGMPDPPIAPVRPQTTWGTSLSGRLNPLNITDHSAPAQVSKEDCAYPRRWMHGGWIHATGFSMVGP